MSRLAAVLALLALTASPALAKHEVAKHRGIGEVGIASVYSSRLAGHKTASGATFERGAFTAAHRNLPFGTKLVVTNKRNGRKVTVTVNDRGPHKKGRIIDLSPAAASQLGMLHAGLAKVDVRIASER
jgi:rare lipoprotein A